MKITDILTESQQLELQEGPMLNKIGSAVGRGVGAAAKGVGAVAGGVAGLGSAFKRGYGAGRDTVASAGDIPYPSGSPAAQTPAAQAPAASAAPAARAPKGKAAPAAGSTVPVPSSAKQAVAKTSQAVAGQSPVQAGQTLYAQVKNSIDQLDKKGKQRILKMLQQSLAGQPAAGASTAGAAPAGGKPAPAAPAGKSVKVGGAAPAAAPAGKPGIQTAGKINNGKVIAEGFQLYRSK